MTNSSLDQVLAQCLEQAEQTGDIGMVLQDHLENADELRPLLELADVARRIYADVPEPPGGLAWGRARLLSQARQTRGMILPGEGVAVKRKGRPPKLPRLEAALIGATLIGAIALLGMVGIARTAEVVVPGHPLYGLDRTLEQFETRLTRDPADAAQLRLRLAEERLKEIAQLALANDPVHLDEALGAYTAAVVALTGVPGDLPAALVLDRVLASHEKQLQNALERKANTWCTGQDIHPLAAGLARCYPIDADTVMGWFCDEGFGFGDIIHALQTDEVVSSTGVPSDTTPGALLALKTDLGGWGKVWQELGLIGQPDELRPPGQEDKPVPPGQEEEKPVPPGQEEEKPEPPGQEEKPAPPGREEEKPVPPGQEEKPVPPGQEEKPAPPGQEEKPVPPGQEEKPAPPGQEEKPEPPGQEEKPAPPGQEKKP